MTKKIIYTAILTALTAVCTTAQTPAPKPVPQSSPMIAPAPVNLDTILTEATKQIADLARQLPKPLPTAMAMTEKSRTPEPSYFLHRGNQKGSVMQPGVLSVAQTEEWPFPAPPMNPK